MNLPATLLDGPCGGRTVRYSHPLPPVLVVADKTNGIRWHDYTQTTASHRYRHSDRCKCRYQAPPVELDVI